MTLNLSTPKIVVVYGATGAQGGSVVRSLIQNKAFKVRGITRDPNSERAQQLRALGVEVVQADGWKKEEITAAFTGGWAAFVNTNSEDPMFLRDDAPSEFDLGKIIIDGIIDAGTVKHLVFSSLVSTGAVSKGRYRVKTTEMKASIEHYALRMGYFETVAPVHVGWYMELFKSPEFARVFGGFPHFPDEQGILILRSPRWGLASDMPIPWISVADDLGDIVHGMLLSPAKYHDTVVPALSDPVSMPEVAAAFERVSGKKCQYMRLERWEDFAVGIPQLEDQRQLFAFGQVSNAKYFGDHPIEAAIPAYLKAQAEAAKGKVSKGADLVSLEQWFQRNLCGDS